MVRKSIIIAVVVLVLGLLSAGAGLAAELTRAKPSQVDIFGEGCVHPSSQTMGLAITAAVALILLRVIVRAATGRGFSCCRTNPNTPRVIRICIILAWATSFLAVGQFIAGAKLCNQKPGIFSTAAIEAAVSMGLTLFYYLVYASTQNVAVKSPSSEVVELEAPPNTNDIVTPRSPPHTQ